MKPVLWASSAPLPPEPPDAGPLRRASPLAPGVGALPAAAGRTGTARQGPRHPRKVSRAKWTLIVDSSALLDCGQAGFLFTAWVL